MITDRNQEKIEWRRMRKLLLNCASSKIIGRVVVVVDETNFEFELLLLLLHD